MYEVVSEVLNMHQTKFV